MTNTRHSLWRLRLAWLNLREAKASRRVFLLRLAIHDLANKEPLL